MRSPALGRWFTNRLLTAFRRALAKPVAPRYQHAGSDSATPAVENEPPGLYAVTIRGRKRPGQRSVLESWFYPMQVGQALPTLPIWLDVELSIDLELESSFEETCRFLRIS